MQSSKPELKKKKESDAKFEEGRRLLADGDLLPGGNALLSAFELQPKDQDKANSIALLLLGQIRANMASDLPACETLLSHLNVIRPNQVLPPDIRDIIARKQQAAAAAEVESPQEDGAISVVSSSGEERRLQPRAQHGRQEAARFRFARFERSGRAPRGRRIKPPDRSAHQRPGNAGQARACWRRISAPNRVRTE